MGHRAIKQLTIILRTQRNKTEDLELILPQVLTGKCIFDKLMILNDLFKVKT